MVESLGIAAGEIGAVVGLLVYAVQLPFRLRLEPSDLALTILADEHLISGYDRYGFRKWAVGYPLLSVLMLIGLFWEFGWQPVAYLLLKPVT